MFIGREFPPLEDQSARIFGTDMTLLLATGETITAITSRLRTAATNDPLPQNHLPVAPQFSGSTVNQLVLFNDPPAYDDPLSLVGNEYALNFAVTTSAGRIMVPWSRFTIKPGFGLTGYAGGSPPAGAQSFVIPVPSLFYTLPVFEGGKLAQDFPIANQTERLTYGFDFAPALSAGETIASATSFLSVQEGNDNAVANDANAYDYGGGPAVSGTVVSQMLNWPGFPDLTANVYGLGINALTSYQQSIAVWARIAIGRIS